MQQAGDASISRSTCIINSGRHLKIQKLKTAAENTEFTKHKIRIPLVPVWQKGIFEIRCWLRVMVKKWPSAGTEKTLESLG
jgi:hypothetical protein